MVGVEVERWGHAGLGGGRDRDGDVSPCAEEIRDEAEEEDEEPCVKKGDFQERRGGLGWTSHGHGRSAWCGLWSCVWFFYLLGRDRERDGEAKVRRRCRNG